ncbi:MAG TPA: hypothetical protein DGB32_09590 [Dehalococcoidia bacterium]|jgi:hypothetical protein|nr:hypothetical protein [Chloroflexota bacterium]HCV28568.1 hypothetical protein [Dehalococcoidia bacterium]
MDVAGDGRAAGDLNSVRRSREVGERPPQLAQLNDWPTMLANSLAPTTRPMMAALSFISCEYGVERHFPLRVLSQIG